MDHKIKVPKNLGKKLHLKSQKSKLMASITYLPKD